jgi:hypothetical protein
VLGLITGVHYDAQFGNKIFAGEIKLIGFKVIRMGPTQQISILIKARNWNLDIQREGTQGEVDHVYLENWNNTYTSQEIPEIASTPGRVKEGLPADLREVWTHPILEF